VRKGLTALACASVALAAGGLVALGRGPVGPETIVIKELQERIESAAVAAHAVVVRRAPADPDTISLPYPLEFRRRLKRLLGRVGMAYPAAEGATEFTMRSQGGPQAARCLVLCRGDHVIGLIVVSAASDRGFAAALGTALEAEFAGYRVRISVRAAA
jgi:hypothetical protein